MSSDPLRAGQDLAELNKSPDHESPKPRVVQKIIFPDGTEGWAHYDLEHKALDVGAYDEPKWDPSEPGVYEVPGVGVSQSQVEAWTDLDTRTDSI